MSHRCLSLPVLVVLSVIVFIYYTTVFIVIDEWLGLKTSPGLLNALIFTFFAFMSVISYTIAIVRDPGHVPATFMPDIEDSENPIHEIKRKGGDLRYCQKCSLYKPPRAHHCRVCRRCVLRMDHHCVWINNCVGHANYKVFFIFVWYSVIACIHAMVILISSAADDVHKDQQQSEGAFKTSYIVCGTILVPLTLALSILLGWHIYLIIHNKTTIEYHEGVRAMWLAEKVGHIYRHPYDVGVYGNLVSLNGVASRIGVPRFFDDFLKIRVGGPVVEEFEGVESAGFFGSAEYHRESNVCISKKPELLNLDNQLAPFSENPEYGNNSNEQHSDEITEEMVCKYFNLDAASIKVGTFGCVPTFARCAHSQNSQNVHENFITFVNEG